MSTEEVTNMTKANKDSFGKRIAIVTFGWPMAVL